MIQELKLEIAKLRRDKYGISSEPRARRIDQPELQPEELETAATEDALATERATEKATIVRAFTRRHPARKPFPDHLPRARVVVKAPDTCSCCGSDHIVKMGEDITETLGVIPRQWKVIQTVRETFTCRACEKISQPPAPVHAIPRGWAGPSLIAMLGFEKYGQHQPLNRQAERFAREGVALSLSTLADLIGQATVALQPIHTLIENHVRAAHRLPGPSRQICQANRLPGSGRYDRAASGAGRCEKGPALDLSARRPALEWWRATGGGLALLRRPFGNQSQSAPGRMARRAASPLSWLQANHCRATDTYGGYNDLYRADRGPVSSALCRAQAHRKFFELADIAGNVRKGKPAQQIAPVALEAVKRIDAIFDIERGISGLDADARLSSPGCLTCPSRACTNFYPGTGRPGPSPRRHDHAAQQGAFRQDHRPRCRRAGRIRRPAV